MTKKLLFVSAIVLVVALAAMSADAITGKWTYEQAGRNGGTPRVITLDLKANGAALTGTILQPAGGRGGGGGGAAPAEPTPTPITNGKVNGNIVSFDVVRESQMGSTTSKYEGTVSGSEMKLKITAPGRGGGDPTTTEVTAKKS